MSDSDDIVTALERQLEDVRRLYAEQGLARSSGFGTSPAVVVVDLIRGFTDPEAPGGVESLGSAVPEVRRILDAARSAGVPVVLVATAYDTQGVEIGAWGRKVSTPSLVHGSEWTEFHEGLGQTDGDGVVVKRYASAFFGTELASRLVSQQVDTVIVAGAATSGCIRATAVDAVQSGFRVVVPRDAVADRHPIPHTVNLFDIGTKYGDVISTDEVVEYLRSVKAAP